MAFRNYCALLIIICQTTLISGKIPIKINDAHILAWCSKCACTGWPVADKSSEQGADGDRWLLFIVVVFIYGEFLPSPSKEGSLSYLFIYLSIYLFIYFGLMYSKRKWAWASTAEVTTFIAHRVMLCRRNSFRQPPRRCSDVQ
jgi:hypothetical protein